MPEQQPEPPKRRRPSWLTAPRALLVTAATALVGWAVTTYAPDAVDEVSGQRAVDVEVITDPARIETFEDTPIPVIVPRGTEVRLPDLAAPDAEPLHPWAMRLGAADASETRLRLVVSGARDKAILLTALRARVLERREPLRGRRLVMPTAGAAEIRAIAIDLDRPGASGRWEEDGKRRPFAFTLARGETEVFDVVARTRRCFCVWRLELDAVVDGESETIGIDAGDRPFRTTVAPDYPAFEWDLQSRWIRYRSLEDTGRPLRPGTVLRP